MNVKILYLLETMFLWVGCTNTNNGLVPADIEISSSSAQLDSAFNWAKNKARSYVMTGKTGKINISENYEGEGNVNYIPSYWAGYPHRSAFYSRDYCHQMVGAHLLGLNEENYTMLKSFVATSTESRKWFPVWALNFDGSIFNLDYDNDTLFVREVPAAFELVEKAYKQYLWTGDERLLTDSTLLNYYKHIVTDFVTMHDKKIPNGVAEGTGTGHIFKGVATYNEASDIPPFIEAGDGIACQYQAFVSYAGFLRAKNETDKANVWENKAAALKNYFEKVWSNNKENGLYMIGYDANKKSHWIFNKETSWFMAKNFITDAAQRNDQLLDYMTDVLKNPKEIPSNIEAITYLPDTYFPYNRVDEGWHWMRYILNTYAQPHVVRLGGTNGDYPEVSYLIISSVVENLMGIEPDAAHNKVATISRLPQEIKFLEVKNITLGKNQIMVRHEGNNSTTIKHTYGTDKLKCLVRFYGVSNTLKVNEKEVVAVKSKLHGKSIFETTITLSQGEKAIVERP